MATKPKMPRTAADIRRAMSKVNLSHDDIARCQVAALLLVHDRLEMVFDLTGEVARLEHNDKSKGDALFVCMKCHKLVSSEETSFDTQHATSLVHDDEDGGCGGDVVPVPIGRR